MSENYLEADERELLDRIREESDPQATEVFFSRYENLLHRFAHKYHSERLPYEDAYQLAALGLLKALRRYDPARGISFITFAYPTVEGELKRHYRDHLEIIRLPRPLRDLRQRINQEARRLWEEEGREPGLGKLAERLGVSEEEVVEALAAQQSASVFSLDAGGADGSQDVTLGYFLGSYDPAYERVERDLVVERALRRLPARHRRIIELRLRRGWTQTKIAHEMKMSQMHVSRLIREAVDMLQGECSSREEPA
jgi:RNA polymerase sigma-B factor